ncbi:hypothetical protein LIER_36827 [Lithospermum erythrorhizon]|uniref:RNase H type-1 domain-containing protein n=1 Tax=Lithospermum erythrorhizon TaxID=34254 RepID=A0AAV3PE00_LITER
MARRMSGGPKLIHISSKRSEFALLSEVVTSIQRRVHMGRRVCPGLRRIERLPKDPKDIDPTRRKRRTPTLVGCDKWGSEQCAQCTTRNPQEEQEYIHELPEQPQWTLSVDEASNPKGSEAEILIQGPEGLQFEYALRFSFETTNKEAEYKAMVTGLMLAQCLSITRMVVRGDSNLVIEQIKGDCGIKRESLQKYYAKATSLTKKFDYFVFEHIPRQENEHADHLS